MIPTLITLLQNILSIIFSNNFGINGFRLFWFRTEHDLHHAYNLSNLPKPFLNRKGKFDVLGY